MTMSWPWPNSQRRTTSSLETRDLLILKRHGGIPIVLPRQFWEILKNKKGQTD